MKLGVLCRDPLMRDGLLCLLSGMGFGRESSVVAIEPGAHGRLASGAFDIVVAAVDQAEIGDLAQLEAARREGQIRVVAISSGASLPAPLSSLADRVVSRELGFEGVRGALESLSAASVREIRSPLGIPRDLTPREREVARLVSRGMPNRTIARTLGIQEQSVKNLVSGVMRKLACENRTQLALQLSSSSY